MSIEQQAAKVIDRVFAKGEPVSPTGTINGDLARALAEHNLLAPSLPTLADMSPEERQACVGMWCDNLASTAKEPAPVVLACVQGEQCWILHTNIHGERSCFPLGSVSPRFDLPRTWEPDGLPVKGEWVEGHMWWGEDTDTMEPVDVVGAECLATGQIQGFDEWPDGVTPGEDVPVRRFITEWEATDE